MKEITTQSYFQHTIISVDPAIRRLGAVAVKFLRDSANLIMREMSFHIPADTGLARSHIRSEVDPQGKWARAGILYPFTFPNSDTVATYPAMMEMGIRRHFVSLYDSDKKLRWSLAAWVVRHGLGFWNSGKTGVISAETGRKMTGLLVWGYRVPWVSGAIEKAKPKIQQMLNSLEGQL